MPTRAGWIVVAGAVAAGAAGRALGAVELYVLAAIALVLVIAAVAWVRRPSPALDVRRHVRPVRPSRGAPARVELELVNRGRQRTPVLTLHDAVEGTVGARLVIAPLAPGAPQQLGYRLPTGRRGRLRIGPLTAVVVDPFGLARRRVVGIGDELVTILPTVEPLGRAPAGGGQQEPLVGQSTRSIATSGIEDLATLRPYVVGDDLRRVHWPSSAHADDLLVRRDEERWQGHLTVLIDVDEGAMGPDAFEQAVSAAATLVHATSEAGDRVRLATTEGFDSAMVDARRAEGDLLEQLAYLAQSAHPFALPVAEGGGRSALVVLTGPGGPVRPAEHPGRERFGSLAVVRFAPDPSAAQPGDVVVAPGRRFAEAWSAADPLARRTAER